MCDHSKDKIRKSILATMDDVILSSHMPSIIVKRFEERAKKKLLEVESELIEFKKELFQELTTRPLRSLA